MVQCSSLPLGPRQHVLDKFEPAVKEAPESGIFWTTTHLTTIRSQLLAAGQSPRVMLRSSVEYSALKLRIKTGQPCIIRGLPEEAEALEQWLQKLPLDTPYRGQRMAGLAHEVLMQLIKAERKQPSPETRQAILDQQNSLRNLRGAEIQLGTCKPDHVVPVRQAFCDDEQALQALCLERHRNKTLLQTVQPTSLESRFNPRACEACLWSPKPACIAQLPHSAPSDRISYCRHCHAVSLGSTQLFLYEPSEHEGKNKVIDGPFFWAHLPVSC